MSVNGGASIVSYLNKNLKPAQIQECLAIANFLAAPFGSREYTLVKYGTLGADSTMEQLNDTVKAVTYGQKTVADYQSVLSAWKADGGGALVAWADANVYQKYGSGQ